jgi:alginate O-acetyltransferase complex protein AlgI
VLFTSFTYIVFLAIVIALYWLLPRFRWQNVLLVAANFLFYGFVHHWFCLLLFFLIVFTYETAWAVHQNQRHRRFLFWVGIIGLVVVLATFKYFNFFYEDITALLRLLGIGLPPIMLRLLLPAGISFYTFMLLGYLIDVYRGTVAPCRSFISFALFASFFSLLISGPIERAKHLLPQIESPRRWQTDRAVSALALLVRGFAKKLVIADNIAFIVDKIFMLDRPPLPLLAVGTFAFALQIFADFSGYTDIARASGRFLGFELVENFNFPFRSTSPSDFWRRWHISLSSWLRDYLFLPMAFWFMRRVKDARWLGIKTESAAYVIGIIATMFLAGLWHGASWNFVAWGIFHGLLMAGYHLAGIKGNWIPRGWRAVAAWMVMQGFILGGWALFRAPSLSWLFHVLGWPQWNNQKALLASAMTLAVLLPYALLLWLIGKAHQQRPERLVFIQAAFHAVLVLIIVMFHFGQANDFIYFRF